MTGGVRDLGINVGQEDHVVKSGSHVTEKEDAGSSLPVGVGDLPVLSMLFTLVAKVSSCLSKMSLYHYRHTMLLSLNELKTRQVI